MTATVSPMNASAGKKRRAARAPVDRATRAAALFLQRADWKFRHNDDGSAYIAIPTSDQRGHWRVDRTDCDCPDHQARRVVCAHMLAVRFWLAAYQAQLVELPDEVVAAQQRDAAALVDDLDDEPCFSEDEIRSARPVWLEPGDRFAGRLVGPDGGYRD